MDNKYECKIVEKIGTECECEKGKNTFSPSNLTLVYFALFFAVVYDAFLYFILNGIVPFALK